AIVQRHPGFALAYNDFGVLCFALGMKDRARSLLERALALDPTHAGARDNLADVYVGLGRPDLVRRLRERPRTGETTAPIAFRSPRVSIDFIAYHDLQAQAACTVFDTLARHFDCRWRIGPDQRPSGAEVAVMLDHFGFHPRLTKGDGGYRHLIHV